MGSDDPVDQSQPEPETTEATGGGGIALGEVVEDRVQPLGRDAEALVGDRDPHLGGIDVGHPGAQGDPAARRRVLDGVVYELLEGLEQVGAIGGHGRRPGRHPPDHLVGAVDSI